MMPLCLAETPLFLNRNRTVSPMVSAIRECSDTLFNSPVRIVNPFPDFHTGEFDGSSPH